MTLQSATVITDKAVYALDEPITGSFTEMLGDEEDWIAIYPVGTDHSWENVVKWDWTGGIDSGTFSLSSVPAGEYEVRIFFENSYNLENKYSFRVDDHSIGASITSNKEHYAPNENIVVNFQNMLGEN